MIKMINAYDNKSMIVNTDSANASPPYIKNTPFSSNPTRSLPTYFHSHMTSIPLRPLQNQLYSTFGDNNVSRNNGITNDLHANASFSDILDDSAISSLSSNSCDEEEDEQFAAAVLHSLESGSLSPQNYFNSDNVLQRRQPKVSGAVNIQTTTRKKRISSLAAKGAVAGLGYRPHSVSGSSNIWIDNVEMSISNYDHGFQHNRSNPMWQDSFQIGGHSSYNGFGSTSAKTIPIGTTKSRNQHSTSPFDSHDISQYSATAPVGGKKPRRVPRPRQDNHQCPNCHTSDSPLWRNCMIKGKILHLCNSCGLRYKKLKYCPLCYKVYYDAETNVHDWCQCVTCHNWTHRQCLAEIGLIQTNMSSPYRCSRCLTL